MPLHRFGHQRPVKTWVPGIKEASRRPHRNPRTYDGPTLSFAGSAVNVSTFATAELPEPASLGLGVLALAAAGVATRRRKSA